ncbi:hypothetical protein CRG98_037057 [Punica granatum]|uniref:Uncharacterized protein n=1 Tax=Punica granatum TaxID=22663 RepID=A0A2I0IEV9_PUNGR|nr:hypothetical protein CRG98_037057 [Punica granatum]
MKMTSCTGPTWKLPTSPGRLVERRSSPTPYTRVILKEQFQVEAQFHPRPIPARSPMRPSPIEGRNPNLNGGLTPYPSPGKLRPSANKINTGKSISIEENSMINIRQRKRKTDISMDEFLHLSAPYAKILNKMARTIGEVMQEDWNAYSSQLWEPAISSMEFQFSPMPKLDRVVTEVEQESTPEEFQMAEEASLIKPPKKP